MAGSSAGTALRIKAHREEWCLSQPFVIARGAMTAIEIVVVEVSDGKYVGRGEACPTAHYDETVDGVLATIAGAESLLCGGTDWSDLHDELRPGAARNALDCAIWDLRAQQSGRPVWQLLGMPAAPGPIETVFTISLADPEAMAKAAKDSQGHAILKLKLGLGRDDALRVEAVRRAVPDKRIIVDVNEGWSQSDLIANLPIMAELGVEMIEQPLPADRDDALSDIDRLVPIGADEACHHTGDLDRVRGLYDVVNIKLDKSGGLTEAMRLAHACRAAWLDIMIGCMLGTSLAMAPSILVAQFAYFVDLDAPLLIGHDRDLALSYTDGIVAQPHRNLWGFPRDVPAVRG